MVAIEEGTLGGVAADEEEEYPEIILPWLAEREVPVCELPKL